MITYQKGQTIWLPVALVNADDRFTMQTGVAHGDMDFDYGLCDGSTDWANLGLDATIWKEKPSSGVYQVELDSTLNQTAGVLLYRAVDTTETTLPYQGAVQIVDHAPATAISTLTTRIGTPSVSDIATELAAAALDALKARQVASNNWKISNYVLTIYDDAGDALYEFNLLDNVGDPTMEEPYERQRVV